MEDLTKFQSGLEDACVPISELRFVASFFDLDRGQDLELTGEQCAGISCIMAGALTELEGIVKRAVDEAHEKALKKVA